MITSLKDSWSSHCLAQVKLLIPQTKPLYRDKKHAQSMRSNNPLGLSSSFPQAAHEIHREITSEAVQQY